MTARRRLVDGAWLYDDPDEHRAAEDLAIWPGFSLAALDNFLDEPGWDSQAAQKNRARLAKWRATALAAHRTGNTDLMLASVNFLQSALQYRELLPQAAAGQKQSQTQRARRIGKPAIDPQSNPSRNDRIRKRHAALVADGRHDATSTVASEFTLSTRQVRRVLAS